MANGLRLTIRGRAGMSIMTPEDVYPLVTAFQDRLGLTVLSDPVVRADETGMHGALFFLEGMATFDVSSGIILCDMRATTAKDRNGLKEAIIAVLAMQDPLVIEDDAPF